MTPLRAPRPGRFELNLAPMVDVMMCLIIFFLLASKLVDAAHRPLNLPYAEAAEEVERAELGVRVTINVRPANESGTAAEYVVNQWDGEQIIERSLVASEVAPYLAGRAQQVPELTCVIRADRTVRYAHVENVLRGCGLAKISKIVFSTIAGAGAEGE